MVYNICVTTHLNTYGTKVLHQHEIKLSVKRLLTHMIHVCITQEIIGLSLIYWLMGFHFDYGGYLYQVLAWLTIIAPCFVFAKFVLEHCVDGKMHDFDQFIIFWHNAFKCCLKKSKKALRKKFHKIDIFVYWKNVFYSIWKMRFFSFASFRFSKAIFILKQWGIYVSVAEKDTYQTNNNNTEKLCKNVCKISPKQNVISFSF